MDQHETQAEVNPTREQWLALHQAFRSYCEVSPWERLSNEDVLVVDDPLGHFKGYCVALGDGGVAYGLGVYLGDRGLHNYLTTMTSEDEPCGVEALERGLALSAVLGAIVKNWATRNGKPCASWASGIGAGADGRFSAASFRATGPGTSTAMRPDF